MNHGHREAQSRFLELGSALGFETALTWSKNEPGDGVWLYGSPALGREHVPGAAIEVVVSEGRKSIRGSIDTLGTISPALGIVMVREAEIRRRVITSGGSPAEAASTIARGMNTAMDAASMTRQRVDVWTFAQFTVRPRLASGCCWKTA